MRTVTRVVGPHEPFGGRSQEDMETGHRTVLRQILQQHGVLVDVAELQSPRSTFRDVRESGCG